MRWRTELSWVMILAACSASEAGSETTGGGAGSNGGDQQGSSGAANPTGAGGHAGTSGTGGATTSGAAGTTTSGGGGTKGGTGGTAGASGAGGAGGAGGSAGSDGGTASGSNGCGKTVAATGSQTGTLMVSGTARTYRYVVPAGYSPNEPIPVTFGFHGRGGNGAQADSWGMHTAATQAGQKGLFIYPDGANQPEGGTGWAMAKTGADVAFFDAMLAWAESTFCLDPKRVFVAGFSWGNDFANALGCFRGDKIRAVNGFSGSFYSSGCTAEVPAYRATYSSPDGTDAYTQAEIDKAVNHYKTALACGNTTAAVTPSPCLSYQGCMKPVVYCAYPNMGHSVPQNGGASAWSFFASFK